MSSPALPSPSAPARPGLLALGVALLAVGCLGHLLAARAIGGSPTAYLHHTAGFVIIAIVTGGIILAVRRWIWKGPFDVTFVAIGLVQALFGVWIWTQRFNIH